MILAETGYLLDVNTLLALAEEAHAHHRIVSRWFLGSAKRRWTLCPLTEAGFLRHAINPHIGSHSIQGALAWLAHMAAMPGFHFLPITEPWSSVTASFASRLFGHQQVNDADLLGLAVKEQSVLVAFDRGLKYLAGTEFAEYLLLLG